MRRMRVIPKHYPVEQRERAVKMVLDHLDGYRSVYAACQVIGPKIGVGCKSLRRWVLQAQVDASRRPVPRVLSSTGSKNLSARCEI